MPVPKFALLDVNGTLFPPSAARDAFEKLGLQAQQVEVGLFQHPASVGSSPSSAKGYGLIVFLAQAAALVRSCAEGRFCGPATWHLCILPRHWGIPFARSPQCSWKGQVSVWPSMLLLPHISCARESNCFGLSCSVSGEEAAEQVVAAWRNAEPYADVGPGIKALRAAGIEVRCTQRWAPSLHAAGLISAGMCIAG
jgi:hypothetical protein